MSDINQRNQRQPDLVAERAERLLELQQLKQAEERIRLDLKLINSHLQQQIKRAKSDVAQSDN